MSFVFRKDFVIHVGLFLGFFLKTVILLASPGFALSEHLALGKNIELQFNSDRPSEKNSLLHLPNQAVLTYGNILSLGDLYGVIGAPISKASSAQERMLRFLAVFKTLANDPSAAEEIRKLNEVIENELKFVEEAINKGETAEAAYKQIDKETGRQINCITGGGCMSEEWWLIPGRYLNLAKENYDHFAPQAVQSYQAGHQVALQQAVKAHQTRKRADLELAYAEEALACHYLSDNFASGHLRTPRVELQEKVMPAIVGGLLAVYMHNEENVQGIHVHDGMSNQWQVWGDFSYFNPNNAANRALIERALQASADEIFAAYLKGYFLPVAESPSFIPLPNEEGNTGTQDISPLFYWDSHTHQLYRRKDITNPYDRHWTTNWWGWSTLLALKDYYGIPVSIRVLWPRELEKSYQSGT